MYIARIQIDNFRNFYELDVELSGNAVIVGERIKSGRAICFMQRA